MSGSSPEQPVKQGQLDPSAMSPADVARLLTSAAGVRIEAAQIEADIESGAPTNVDGTVNLVHYAAWLVRQMAEGARGGAALGD